MTTLTEGGQGRSVEFLASKGHSSSIRAYHKTDRAAYKIMWLVVPPYDPYGPLHCFLRMYCLHMPMSMYRGCLIH